MLLLFNKLKSNFQINQPLGMNHRIDGWISGARKPGQAEEYRESMGTTTSFAFALEHGPPNEQQSGLEQHFRSVGAGLVQDDTHIRTFPLERD